MQRAKTDLATVGVRELNNRSSVDKMISDMFLHSATAPAGVAFMTYD